MRHFFVLILLYISIDSWSQVKITESDLVTYEENWNDGVVVLMDGTELRGKIWYNHKISLLNFSNGNVRESLTAQTAQSFEFLDEKMGATRKFYSLDITHAPGHRPLFFELLKEFKNFTMMTLTRGLDLEVQTMNNPRNIGQQTRYVDLSERELIFFFTPDGNSFPYLEIEAIESTDGIFDYKKAKSKIINQNSFERLLTPPVYKKLAIHAKENDLRFKVKKELLMIMDYYAILEEHRTDVN